MTASAFTSKSSRRFVVAAAIGGLLAWPTGVSAQSTTAGFGDTCEVVAVQELYASDPQPGQAFGFAAAINGDTLAIGALGDDDGGDIAGAVYVFRREGAQWTEEIKLLASDATPGARFGSSLAAGPERIVVGTFGANAAYVLRDDGETWIEEVKLVPSEKGGFGFGRSVHMSADRIIVGGGNRVRQGRSLHLSAG